MKVIAMVCQKGGTSKTTLALNLAVAAQQQGQETVVIDLDPQVSAYDWKDIRGEERAPTVAAVPAPHLDRTLKAAAASGADLVIIDTAGRANDVAAAAARVADAILIPMQPSLIDLKTLQATLSAIAMSGNDAPVRVVLSRVKAFGTRHEDSAEWLSHAQVDICPVLIGERVVFQDAYGRGLGVVEVEPGGKAAEEIRELYKYTCQLFDMQAGG